MKKILLLTLAACFSFSCSEYSDDGTPGDIILINPDGTKKIKTFNSEASGQINNDILGEMGPLTIDITTNQTFSSDSYSNQTEVFMTITNSNGMSEAQETLISRLNQTLEGNKITSIDGLNMENGNASRVNYSFDYSENQLSSFSSTQNGILLGNGNFNHSPGQITVDITPMVENFVPLNWVFTVSDSLITSASAVDSNEQTTYTLDFTRSNGNITGISIASAGSAEFTYTYDSNINPLHQVYTNNLDRTNAEIVRILTSGFSTQAGGSALDVSNFESAIRRVLVEGTNNLLTANSGSQVLLENSYTYDEEGYPVGVTSRMSQDISLAGSMDSIIATYTQIIEGMGLDQEEIDIMLQEFLAELEGTISVEMEQESTISYFE